MALNIESVLGKKASYLTADEASLVNDMSTLVLMDGIAIVDEEKAKKLTLFLLKKIQPFGSVIRNDIYIPLEPSTGLSLGVAFFEMKTADEAKKVIAGLDNTPMDRTHTFHVYNYSSIVSILNDEKESSLPDKENYLPLKKVSTELGDLYDWMKDSLQRDEFVIRYTNETEIYWCDTPRPQAITKGEDYKKDDKVWCNGNVEWSPLGTYLTTFHPQGVIIWGGNKFIERGRFIHAGVRAADFSKEESYLLTWNGQVGLTNKEAVCVWDVRTNQVLRKFPCSDRVWPSFQFSADEKFLASKGNNGIGIFMMPSMQMVQKSCFGISSISNYQWAPVGSIISYYIPEQGGKPATVVLLDVATDRRVQSVSFTNVEDLTMIWSPNGDYLALLLTRYPKKKGKNLSYQISIVRLADKNAPVETIALPNKVVQLAWEPTNLRFALVLEEKEGRRNVAFYNMLTRKGNDSVKEVSLFYTITDKPCNQLYWSPAGNYLLLAGLGVTMKGRLEFWDVSGQTSLREQEYFSCTDIAWAPNGHYVVTSSCLKVDNKQDYENGYDIWNNRGDKVFSVRLPKFYDFQFRPWPLLTVTEDMKKDVKKNMSAITERYKDLGEKLEAIKHIGDIRKKLSLIDAFEARKERMLAVAEELNRKRVELFGDNKEYITIVEYVDEKVIEETEILA